MQRKINELFVLTIHTVEIFCAEYDKCQKLITVLENCS